jgi:hypothetical protein
MLRQFALGVGVFLMAMPAAAQLETLAEQSGFQRTGRYAEVERLCAAFAAAFPDAVRCTEFGRTPEGRPMLALVASRTGALTPDAARQRNLPVLLFQGGIHAGESDGKDAGFLALRQLLRDEAAPGALKSIVVVFVPIFSADGHERFGRWNRPNQAGPEEMGWRTTAQNLNLNRDYMKADAPEMQAMLRLLNAWDPILYADLHVTDGAQFEHDVSNTAEPVYVGDAQMQPAGRALLAELNAVLTAAGSLPVDFYPDLVRPDDPTSGFVASAYPPRFSTGYWPLRNRFALLVETHSWKDYPTRVRVTHRILVTLAEMAATHSAEWLRLARGADQRASQIGGQDVAIDFQTGPETTTIEFRGYAYTREPSAVSGALVTRYDPSRPQVWRVPFRPNVVPRTTVAAPRAGYIVPAAHAGWVGEKLALHAIRFERLERAPGRLSLETFRADQVEFAAAPFEGRQTVTVSGAWRAERRDVAVGALFVPIAQPNARVIMGLLEPQAPDSLAAWGFFNNAFERKEYMEAYVAEQVAADMLKDPAVAAEFRNRLAEDPEFARSPQARLDFFYRRHPSFDERLNLYPVFRTASAP